MKTIVSVFHIILLVFCLGFFPEVQAVNPPPDGGYPGGNTAEGTNALFGQTTGGYNAAAIGWQSLRSLTTANFNTGVGAATLTLNNADSNTAIGAGALLLNTIGEENTAIGAFALLYNSEGDFNTANGTFALFANTTGERNTAIGDSALYQNTEGSRNTAVGNPALLSNTSGNDNTAVGSGALSSNTADENTAVGSAALSSNTTGFQNTAIGDSALTSNTIGGSNTAIGNRALRFNTTGGGNTASGLEALVSNTDGGENTAYGLSALNLNTSGNRNVALGAFAGGTQTTGSNNVYIGYNMNGPAGESNACYIASIFNQTSASGAPVLINANNKLGTTTSSKRFKDNIHPMENASQAIFALKPITFRYKKEIDPTGKSQFGLVAEDVEQVNADLVVRDKEGKPYSVRYDQVNAMLLNEFLKEHKKVERYEATIAELKKQVESLVAHSKEQDSQIQRVRQEVEMSKTAPQLVTISR